MIDIDSFERSVRDRGREKADASSTADLIESYTNQHSVLFGKTMGKKRRDKTGPYGLNGTRQCRQLLFTPELIQRLSVLEMEQTWVRNKTKQNKNLSQHTILRKKKPQFIVILNTETVKTGLHKHLT